MIPLGAQMVLQSRMMSRIPLNEMKVENSRRKSREIPKTPRQGGEKLDVHVGGEDSEIEEERAREDVEKRFGRKRASSLRRKKLFSHSHETRALAAFAAKLVARRLLLRLLQPQGEFLVTSPGTVSTPQSA